MLVLCTVIWGGTFPAVKFALKYTSPWMIVFARFAIAAVFFAILHRGGFLRMPWKIWSRGILLGLFFFAGFGLQTLGLQSTTASRSAFLTETLVLITPVLYFIMYRRLPSRYTLSGAALVLFGLYLLTSPEGLLSWNRGDWLTLGCAVAFSGYILGVGIWSEPHSRGGLATIQSCTVALLALPMAFAEGFHCQASTTLIWALAYLAFPGTVIVIILQMRYQPLSTPPRAGVIFALEPVFAMIYAFALALEEISGRAVLGAVVVTAGVVLSEVGELLRRKLTSLPAPREDY